MIRRETAADHRRTHSCLNRGSLLRPSVPKIFCEVDSAVGELDDHGIVTCQNNNLEKLKKVLAKMLLKSYTNEVASSGGHRISL